jgi:hypothetical protein
LKRNWRRLIEKKLPFYSLGAADAIATKNEMLFSQILILP